MTSKSESSPTPTGTPWPLHHELREDRPAVRDDHGSLGYGELSRRADQVAARLRAAGVVVGDRVALWLPPGNTWVVGLLGAWRTGALAVPLALAQPPAELAWVLDDAGASMAILDPTLEPDLRPLLRDRSLPWTEAADASGTHTDPAAGSPPGDETPALLVYTSGTTGRPKGVVLSHGNLRATVDSLRSAWEWSAQDRILSVLPLHHVHGIVNVVLCSLASAAECRFLSRFEADRVWEALLTERPTLFMAVPTMYQRLIHAWESYETSRRAELGAAARCLRLMVSGSAPLPGPVLERWREITGHTLLERYGMTEIGMALSNPLRGERRPGTVGRPLPGVEVRLVPEEGGTSPEVGGTSGGGVPGELEVRGPAVFSGYWRRPEETARAFRDGWFRTGDIAVREHGVYRLLGRRSTDILKTGGEKVSALEVEATLRGHPAVADCAVVGLPDPEWGQKVAAGVELVPGASVEAEELRSWAKERLAAFKVPRQVHLVEALPRNALGKVVKKSLADQLAGGDPEEGGTSPNACGMGVSEEGGTWPAGVPAPPVAAIVLNYNGRDITLQALASLAAMTYPAFDLVHVDNGSSDGSYDAVHAAQPQVIQLRTEENLGAAGGCNLGMRWALDRGYQYLLLLNNDIEVDPELLTEMVRLAEADPRVGVVGPKAYYYWERERIWSAGGMLRFRESVTRERGDGEIDRGQYDEDAEVSYVNGCAMLVRRRAVEEAGLWDPVFHLAIEDADFCVRIKRRGYRCAYAHRARLWHMVSYATGVYKPGRTFQTGRGTAIFLRRYARPHQWLTALAALAVAIPVAFLRELPRGNQGAAVAKIKGFLAGLRTPLGEPPRWSPSPPAAEEG